MQRIFSPSIILLNRMSYTRKFSLLWLVSLVAIAVVMHSLFTSLDRVIQPSQKQLLGLPLIEPVSRSIQLLQQHRGFSAAQLTGKVPHMQNKRAATESRVAAALQAVEESLPHSLASYVDFQHIKSEWALVRREGLTWSTENNFTMHTHLIEEIQLFQTYIADQYRLTPETDIATFYLIDVVVNRLPYMLEHLGQLRAYGTGVLASKQINESQKARLNALLGKFDNTFHHLRIGIEKTAHYNASVRTPILDTNRNIVEAAQKITRVVESDILSGDFNTSPEVFLDMATVEIDKGYAQITNALLPLARNLIESRIAEAKRTLYMTVSTATLLFLLVVYLSISIYYAIVGSIHSLVKAAHNFADGDLSQRLKLGTRDELGQIGDSFNKMADSFSAMLVLRKQAEEKFQSLVESSSDWIWEMDDRGIYIYASPKVKDLLGYEPFEVIGKTAVDLMTPEEKMQAGRLIEEILYDKKPFSGLENGNMHKDGHLVVLETSGVPVFDKEGVFCGYRGIDRDITQRKQDQMQLESSRAHLRNVFDSTNDNMFIIDQQGSIIDINRTGYESLGYSKEELLGMKLTELDTPEFAARVPERLAQIRKRGMAIFESAHRRKDGSVMPVEVSSRIIELDGDEVFLSAVRDITERKQAENELRKLNATLEARVEERTQELKLARDQADAANQAKSSFLSNMSHEIRSPLTAVIGFSESLLTDDLNEPERIKITSTIVRNGRHLLQVINDVLDLSKIEAGQLKVEHINASIFLLMGEIDSLLGTHARDKGLDIKITYHFPLPETIITDPTSLKQILVNLCSNAIKFTDKGRIEIEVSSDKHFRQIQFVVSDSGIGMTSEEVKLIFDPFAQADSSTTRKYGGTGLGLSISRRLANALDGELTCESSKDRGSRFTLTITNHDNNQPVVINSLEEASPYHDAEYDQLQIKPLAGSILLVEDSPDNQQLISMYIRKTGAQLSIAENGKHAIELVQAQAREFDLILMDMQMPVMDGVEAIRQLRATGYKGSIVSLTANAMLTDREKCEAAGANGYLVKPIDLHQFYQVLNSCLAEDTGGNRVEKSQKPQQAMQESPQYKAVVERFLVKLPQMLAEIDAALIGKNWEKLQASSHDLKGIGGALGYPVITEKAGLINDLVKQKSYDQLVEACADLMKTGQDILRASDLP